MLIGYILSPSSILSSRGEGNGEDYKPHLSSPKGREMEKIVL
jgi:hypothetical protein